VVAVPPAADEAAIARAREEMRKKLSEVPPPQPAPAVAVKPPPTPAPAETPKPKPAPAPAPAVAVKPAPAPAPAAQPKPVVAPAKPQKDIYGFTPIQGPPLPISEDKQQQLAELLRKYRADELTPEQYHAERARILAK
jgi:hypothetical protein